jgi:hypothetical protein
MQKFDELLAHAGSRRLAGAVGEQDDDVLVGVIWVLGRRLQRALLQERQQIDKHKMAAPKKLLF